MKCEQCSNPIETIPGTPSKFPELKRKAPGTPRVVDGPDGKASWVVAFAAFMINFIMAGLSRMSGILYVAFIEMFKVDRKSASMPFSVRSSTMNLLGPVVGVLGQKYGVRKVSVIGGIVGTISAAACYFGDNILWLTILWGGLNGVGTALVTTLTTVIVSQYFDKYKTTAAGMSFSGACIGSFIFPPLIEWLLEIYGLNGSFLIVAGITMHCIPAAMILKKPSWVKRANRIKTVESTKENKEKNMSHQSKETDEDFAKNVDLNYLRTNSELVVKLMTTDISAKDEKCVVFPPEDDILKEMEDVYSFIGEKPALPSSEASPEPRNELETTPVRSNNKSFRSNRLSVDDAFHTPVRKVKSSYSVLESSKKSQCKPFITSKLSELCNKSESLIMFHLGENSRYTKVLKELRMLHKIYEAVKKRKIFSQHSPLSKTPSKIVPKLQHLKKTTTSSGIWNNIVNSIKLHGNPLFLLVSICRAVHFSTFIPAITIIVDYAMDKGLKEEDGIYVIAILSVGDLLGRLCLGWVTDRGFITLPRYMMLAMILQGMCTAGFPLIKRKATLLPLTCMYALLQGSVFVRHSVLISKYMKPEEQSIAQGCVNFFAGLSGFGVPYYVGVLWMGNIAIPGSVEAIRALKNLGKHIIYVTNNSTKARAEYLTKMTNLGLPAKVENIITTSYCTAAYLKMKQFQKKVYVLGSTGITQELDNANIQHLPIGPDPVPDNWIHWLNELKLDPEVGAVVVGFDQHISYAKITKAASYLKQPETIFIATNRDEQFPAEGNLIIPGAGTFVSAVEVVTGRKSISVGKPEKFMLDCIKEVYPDIDVNRCIMIGDRLNTDIIFGNKHGIRTLLVLTGISTLEEVRYHETSLDDDHQMQIPDYYLPCLGDIKYLLK